MRHYVAPQPPVTPSQHTAHPEVNPIMYNSLSNFNYVIHKCFPAYPLSPTAPNCFLSSTMQTLYKFKCLDST